MNGRLGKSWAAPAVTFLLGLILFSLNLDRPAHPDELHHVLAAERLLESGRPLLAEGEYARGILYTWLVAISYALFGESLSSARIPSVLLVASIAPILFVWVRREAGVTAAWITSLLFISSPFVVEIAQFSRFYSLQMLFFTLACICTFYSATASDGICKRGLLAGVAVALFALSLWVQDTTIIGLLGVGVWFVGFMGMRVFRDLNRREAAWRVLAFLLITIGILILARMMLHQELAWAWQRYRSASLFATKGTDQFWYYHLRYLLFYPTLWPFIGVLAVAAAARNPRLTLFAVTVFGVDFLTTSFAAQKATRYFSYVQPLLAIVWGVGLSVVLPPIWRSVQLTGNRVGDLTQLSFGGKEMLGRALILSSLVVVILTNPFWLRSAAIIGNVTMPMESPMTDWRVARDSLAPWTAGAEIMITTEELGAMYFLGRSDIRFSPSKFDELPRDQRFEFGIDPRIGRPIITRPESLEKLIECFDSGFMVGPVEHWGDPIRVSSAVQDVLRRHAHPIEVPRSSYLYAWGWRRHPTSVKPPVCAKLERFSGLPTRQ